MGRLLVLQNDGIYLPDGSKYVAPPKPIRVQILRETHVADPLIQKRINSKVGLNRFGEPLFRVVWGWSRLDWVAGLVTRFDDRGEFLREEYGLFLEPKYSYLGREKLNRWMVEKWCPPEDYGTPETWAYETTEIEGTRAAQAMGPYPSRGEYELSFLLEEPGEDSFLQLTPTVVDFVVETAQQVHAIGYWKRKQLLAEEEERKERARKAELEDMWDDARPAFGGAPNSTQANAPGMRNTKSAVKDAGRVRAFAPRGMSQGGV